MNIKFLINKYPFVINWLITMAVLLVINQIAQLIFNAQISITLAILCAIGTNIFLVYSSHSYKKKNAFLLAFIMTILGSSFLWLIVTITTKAISYFF